MRSVERRNVNVLHMKCFRSSARAARIDRDRNDEVQSRPRMERELTSGQVREAGVTLVSRARLLTQVTRSGKPV